MNKFKNGVSYYTNYTLTDKVGFPEDDVCCGWCKYLGNIRTLNRFFCRVTGDTVYNVDVMNKGCPLKKEEG